MKLSTQNTVRKCPHEENIKGTELAPQSQQEKKIPLRHLHPLIFKYFPVLYLILFEIYFFLYSEPLPLERGPSRYLHLKKPFPAQEALQGFYFFFPFSNHSSLQENPRGFGFVFLFFPLSLPCTLRAPGEHKKRGCGSWGAHHQFGRSCSGNSAHTPADVRVWNKSGSLACLGRPPQG